MRARPVFVVIPCFREEVVRVQRSVDSALAISEIDRVSVVDDGSPVPLALTPHDRVSIVRRVVNGGPSAALNAGISPLPADAIVCRLDVGDTFIPETKSLQIYQVRHQRCRASFSWHYDPVRDFIRKPDDNWQRRIFTDNQFGSTTTVFERSAWEEIGGFDDTMRWTDDWRFAMWLQWLLGWHEFPSVTGEHGMYPGGHSDVAGDPIRHAARDADMRRTVDLARALHNPRMQAHLFDPTWCKKRGRKPIVVPPHRSIR